MARSAKNGTQPNILVIWGDDIGQSNLSYYTHGLMGYHTPNIDRIAKEGMLFTDSYGEQSCTAGRSSFITGQSVLRTGRSKVGIPAAPVGMNDKIVTIAALLKGQGYATGQFGKNHLGDLNPMLPTNHGFDEFFGNLYHRRGRTRNGQLPFGEGFSELSQDVRAAGRDSLLGKRRGRSNGIVQHHDWMPTILAMAGAPEVIDKLKKGYKAIGRTYKNHIDGFDLVPYLTGKVKESPRNFFFYVSDDGDVLGIRFDNWKVVFMEQRCHGTMQVWAEPFTRLRLPKIFNLRTDPSEFADITSNTYWDWMIHNAYFIYGAQAAMARFADSFKAFPIIQKPNTFTVDDAIRKMSEATSGAG